MLTCWFWRLEERAPPRGEAGARRPMGRGHSIEGHIPLESGVGWDQCEVRNFVAMEGPGGGWSHPGQFGAQDQERGMRRYWPPLSPLEW